MLRRIGVVGDVHCEDQALTTALAHLRDSGVDEVLAVGDIVDGPGDANRCCALLAEGKTIAVRGNHDRWVLEGQMRDLPDATPLAALDPSSLEFLQGLPVTQTLESVSGRVLLCHGLGNSDMAGLRPDDEGYALENNDALNALLRQSQHTFVVNGHTHRRMVRRVGTLTVINAGTLHHDDCPCFCIIDFERERVEFFDITPEGAPQPAEARALAEWTELF